MTKRSVTKDDTEILKAVLTLPAETRAAWADGLLESRDNEVEPLPSLAAGSHGGAEIDSGAVRPVPWPEVRARLRSLLPDGE